VRDPKARGVPCPTATESAWNCGTMHGSCKHEVSDRVSQCEIAQRMAREIHQIATGVEDHGSVWRQTHSIIKNGIDQMLPATIEMIMARLPGWCVTAGTDRQALAIARSPE